MESMHPFTERFNLTIKDEILNRMILIDADYVPEVYLSCQKFYSTNRPHQRILGRIPCTHESDSMNKVDLESFEISKSKEMAGLVTQFRLAA